MQSTISSFRGKTVILQFHWLTNTILGIYANCQSLSVKTELNCCWHRNARALSNSPHCNWNAVSGYHHTIVQWVRLGCQSLQAIRWIHYFQCQAVSNFCKRFIDFGSVIKLLSRSSSMRKFVRRPKLVGRYSKNVSFK